MVALVIGVTESAPCPLIAAGFCERAGGSPGGERGPAGPGRSGVRDPARGAPGRSRAPGSRTARRRPVRHAEARLRGRAARFHRRAAGGQGQRPGRPGPAGRRPARQAAGRQREKDRRPDRRPGQDPGRAAARRDQGRCRTPACGRAARGRGPHQAEGQHRQPPGAGAPVARRAAARRGCGAGGTDEACHRRWFRARGRRTRQWIRGGSACPHERAAGTATRSARRDVRAGPRGTTERSVAITSRRLVPRTPDAGSYRA
jgi:hypothetical protein